MRVCFCIGKRYSNRLSFWADSVAEKMGATSSGMSVVAAVRYVTSIMIVCLQCAAFGSASRSQHTRLRLHTCGELGNMERLML